ncbi:MAG TPA: hypothetical protein VEC09_04770, partial [Actinomycetota bacterium]|nr:hypothetical protein [Actinomycetota bacterium]
RGGCAREIVSEALGHSSVSFTLDTYSHVVPGLLEQAAPAIAEALEARSASRCRHTVGRHRTLGSR